VKKDAALGKRIGFGHELGMAKPESAFIFRRPSVEGTEPRRDSIVGVEEGTVLGELEKSHRWKLEEQKG